MTWNMWSVFWFGVLCGAPIGAAIVLLAMHAK